MNVLTCSEEWVGTSCSGELANQDISGLVASATPFDWSVVEPGDLMFLFSVGAGLVLTIGFAAWSARIVLDVIRKS